MIFKKFKGKYKIKIEHIRKYQKKNLNKNINKIKIDKKNKKKIKRNDKIGKNAYIRVI